MDNGANANLGPALFLLAAAGYVALRSRPTSTRKTTYNKNPLHCTLYSKSVTQHQLIKRFIRKTPLLHSKEVGNGSVFFKMESRQLTGSFKLRGALSKVLTLSEEEKKGLITTASTGNHGLACMRAFAQGKVGGVIYLPGNVSQYKLNKLKALVGEGGVKVVGGAKKLRGAKRRRCERHDDVRDNPQLFSSNTVRFAPPLLATRSSQETQQNLRLPRGRTRGKPAGAIFLLTTTRPLQPVKGRSGWRCWSSWGGWSQTTFTFRLAGED